jgi:hypothetical protein
MKTTLLIAATLFALGASADDPNNCPMHAAHMAAAARSNDVDRRGDEVMGFPHVATKHSFKIYDDGGAIEVRALRADDEATVRAIHTHLQSIAKSFAAGDFANPAAIHGPAPVGTDVMAAKKDSIVYRYSDLENGGRVRITTTEASALDAVHRFLRFQIEEHRTGDATK